MSSVLIPVIVVGGMYLAMNALSSSGSSGKTQKKRHGEERKEREKRKEKKETRKHKKRVSTPDSISDTSSDSTSGYLSSLFTQNSSSSSTILRRHHRRTRKRKSHEKKKKSSSSSKREKWIMINVYYNDGEKSDREWDYQLLPPTWKVEERLHSTSRTKEYEHLDVFVGKNKYKDQMKIYLLNTFYELREDQMVEDYQITSKIQK